MFDDERLANDALARLPAAKAPDSIWNSIEAKLDQPVRQRPWFFNAWAYAVTAAVIVIAAAATYWHYASLPRWEVIRSHNGVSDTESIRAGQSLQTDASSTAEIKIGTIGTVEVEPGTRLRIVTTKPTDHRLSLEHGEIAATISAPPKLFFVETKSALATDLGCQYKMKVDDAGNGLLRVTLGWVSFDWKGRESLVPAGASCRTRAGLGPGTPFFDDAPKDLTAALDEFDFANGGESALRAILANARSRDTLTLWHLLFRVRETLRPMIYDRMVSFAPPPNGVTREKALALDPQTLKMWKDELAWTW
jgi:hypothetical protein